MRYDRQMILPEIGRKGQEAIARARVLVIGAGGLGCPTLLYLAGAGIGTIGIVDHGQVDIPDLNRQILFCEEDRGAKKAVVAREKLLALNPEIDIRAYAEELTDLNAISLFSGYDIIVDGTDSSAARFLINDVAVKLKKPVVCGEIQKFEGRVSVFNTGEGPCYRCLYPQSSQDGIVNCTGAGVIGALAGIIGTIQAMEVIKIIVGHSSFKPSIGKLWIIDSRTMETSMINIPERKDCPVCSRPAAEIIPQYSSPVCAAATVVEISCAEFSLRRDFTLIDVREREEWDCGHIPGSMNLPLSALNDNPGLYTPPERGACLLYCQRGVRSKKAAEILLQAGYTNIYSLTGGYAAWREGNPRF